MNFPGRFDPKASDAAYVSLDGDQFSFASNTSAASPHNTGSGNIIVPDSHLLFSGDYKRAGNDLVLSSGDKNYVVHDYFKGDKRPALISADGATLSGSIVTALTGHTQYAQAGAPASGQVVGSVMKLTGSASAIRNGVAIQLNIGDAVQKGDVIQTGSDSSIGLTLADGTVFGMSSNARMVLNELIYDPNGSSNSSLFSLVQGTITFVAGQTAKNGNMRVDTPVATMGIRGTAVLVEISANDGPTKFSVLLEPDGKTGSFNLYDKVTGQLLGTVSQAGQVTFVSPMGVGLPALATELPKTLSDLQAEKQLIQQVFQLYFPNYTPDDSRPNSTKTGPRTDIGVPENVIGKYAINPDTGRATITYTVQVTNPDTHQTSNVNIVYTNTPPSFATTNAFDEQSTVLGPNSFKLGDHVTITDPDIGVAPFFDVPFRYVANTGQIAQATGPSSVPGTYLVGPSLLTLNTATGVVTYNPSAFRFLGEGEKAVYKFTFIAASGVGGSGSDAASQTVYLTVTGQNDAPLFAVNDTPLSFDETAHQIGQSTAHLIVPIELHFTDEDFSDVASTFTVSKTVATNVAGNAMTTPDLSKLPGNVTLASYLTIDSTIDSATGVTRTALSNAGIVTGKFSAPDNVFDFLAEGEQVQLVYTITISDGHAGSSPSTQTVTITVTGTNDTPEVSVANDTFGLNESTGATIVADVLTLTSSGSVHFTDADLTDTHSTSKPVLSTAVWLKPDGQGGYVSAGTIPTDTMNAVATAAGAAFVSDSTGGLTGQVNWNFALADSLVDFLAENETLTLVYNVVVNDGHTDVGIATQPITIVITGTNDTPTVAAPLTITATEGDAPIVRDLLDGAADLDNGETATLTVENIKYSVNGGAQTTTAPDGITFPNGTTINVDAAGFDHIAGGATETIVVTYDVTDVHGATVEQTETITIAGVNDRPVLAAGTDLTPITEDETANNGQTVASFATGISDVDDGAQQGIAITGYTSSHGQWQFSTNGGSTWTNFGTYSPTEGLLLASDDMVRFVPDAENGSVDTLTYVAWDRTTGTRGLTADSTAGGDSSAFSQVSQTATLTVTDVNDTPTVSSALTLDGTEGDAPIVRDLLAGASDVDTGETDTLTVTNIRYSTDGGPETMTTPAGISFPDAHTINVAPTDPAFDHIAAGATQTIVVTYDVTDVHGATVEQTETITIAGVNDRPVLAAGTDLTSITEDETANNGQTVSSFATGISDADDSAQQGIAITGYTSSHGQWQFSTNGGSTWTNFGTYSPTVGLLLASDDRVRFVPDGNNGSVDTLTYVAWDQTSGTHGVTASTMTAEHWSAFSQDSQTATITVTDVNDAPVIISNSGGTTATITVDENTTSVTTVQATDVDGPNVTYEIVTGLEWPDANKFAINPTTGELTFVNPPDFEAYGSANGDNTYRVQVRATDGTLTDTQTLTVNVADVVEGPTYLVYSTLNDESPGTLRSAILFANANPNTTITFVAGGSWNGAWVLMVNDLPAITGDGTVIDGTAGAAQVLLQANGSPSRIFTVGNGVDNIDVTIRNIGMRYGAAEKQDGSNALGGAIYVAENVHLRIADYVNINDNHASAWNGGSAFGGAIYLADGSTLELAGRVVINSNYVSVSGTDGNGVAGTAMGAGIYMAGPDGEIILKPNQQTGAIELSSDIANGPANGNGVQHIVVDGDGLVSINTVNSFSGTLNVHQGTLLVNYQAQMQNAAVTVEDHGVLIGGGSQPIYATGVGDLTVLSGGVLAPGSTTQYGSNSAMTAVFRTGSFTMETGSTLAMDANGYSPGVYSVPGSIIGYDQILVNGTVTLNGATLTLGGVNGYNFSGAIGANFTIIDNDGIDAVIGAFAGKAEGSTFYSGGDAYAITYHGGDGNDVVVTRVADPPIIDLNGLISGTGALVNYTEGTVLRLVPDAILLDNDQTYLPSGSLTVAITQNGSGTETFSIEVGGPNNPLSANGSWIAYNGTNIASFSGGMNGNPLVINFRAMGSTPTYYGPTPAEIAEILKHITIAIPADNNPQSLTRQITFTVQDGEGGQSSALASVNVLDVGSAPFAGDDTISMRSDYGALKSTLITNDFDPDDQPSEKNFEISGAAHLVPDVSSTPATPITGGFKAEGKYGTLFLYSVATFDPIFNATANAGDYVFNVGRDINGNLLPGSQLAPIYDLAPGELLKDFFTYTITDPNNNTSAPALITVNFEAGPVSQHVERATGYNVTQLWDDIHFGTLTSISPTQLIVENAGRSIAIDAKNLTWSGTIETEIVLTGGLIKGFHATEGGGALFDATGYNINAADFDSAVSNVSPVALYNILKTYGYDIHGGPGADGLLGGDLDPNGIARDDRIDTGGGTDSVLAFGGNDLIVIYDNKAWQIDGGAGIDTIRLDGQFDLINGPSSQGALNIEIFDLNQTYVNSIGVDPEGVYQINADHAVRVLGNAQDTVALQKASSGYWEKSNSHVAYSGDYATAGTYFDLYSYVGGPTGTQAALYVQEGVGVRTDVLNGDAASALPDGNGTTTVVNVVLNDPYQNANYSVSATASLGSVTLSSNGMPLDQGAVSANVATINSELGTGIVYTPDTPSSPTDEIYDNVSLTVVDTWGISDTLNFVFRQQGTGSATLTGTNDKDIIFSTENSDTLTGLSGKDNFVFANSSGHDIVTDFQVGIDHLVLNDYSAQFTAGDQTSFLNWRDTSGHVQQSGNDTIIDLDPLGTNTITLQNVQKANLSMNDFILHPGGGLGV